MQSEIVERDQRGARRPSKLRLFSPLGLLARLVRRRNTDDDSYDPAVEKERLISRALTRREQEAYSRTVELEREIQQSALQSTRKSLATAERDCETASGLFLDSGLREAAQLGRIFYENRQQPAVKLAVVQ